MGVELTGPCGGCWHGYNLMEFIFKAFSSRVNAIKEDKFKVWQ